VRNEPGKEKRGLQKNRKEEKTEKKKGKNAGMDKSSRGD
jgi:hypothetical protein